MAIDDCTLGGPDGASFLELTAACSRRCVSTEMFQGLIRTFVRPLLPHRFSIAVLGSLSFDHLSIRHMIGVDYPESFLERIPRHSKLADRPVVAKWLSTREPLIVDPARDRSLLSPLELREIETFGLGRIAVHGQIDLSSSMASYFSFAGTHELLNDQRARFVLRLITPHLHAALVSIPAMSMSSPMLDKLTRLERELLVWLAAGRSNAEIATLRGRSPTTVRNQISTLFRKIQVSTRAEAVAFAASQAIGLDRLHSTRTNDP
jgi:DNA-binding CsgD family transcriptional regulator